MNQPPTPRMPSEDDIWLSFSRGGAADIMDDLPLGHSVSKATQDLYLRLREELRKPPQGGSVPHFEDIDYAPMQPIRAWPDVLPRRGRVVRKHDITGISGVGVIAEFCQFSDNAVAWRWLGGAPQHQPKWEFYDNPGVAPFLQISGHNGNTEIVWIDEDEPSEAPGQ